MARHIVYGWDCSDMHIELEQRMFDEEHHRFKFNDDGTVDVEHSNGTWFTTFTQAKREAVKRTQEIVIDMKRVLNQIKAVRKDEL